MDKWVGDLLAALLLGCYAGTSFNLDRHYRTLATKKQPQSKDHTKRAIVLSSKVKITKY